MAQFELEEDVFWSNDSKSFEWVFGQQRQFHLVRPFDNARVTAGGVGENVGARALGWLAAKLGWQMAFGR